MKKSKAISAYKRELTILLFLIVIIVVFSLMNGRYFKKNNLIDIVEQSGINGFLAIGMTFVLLTAGIDLSVGGIMSVAIIATAYMSKAGASPFLVLITGLVIGAAIGSINGLLIGKMRLQPFIATLAVNSIMQGLSYVITGGWPVTQVPREFREFLEGSNLFGIENSAYLFVICIIICHFILKKTRFGTYLYAIGNNEEATRLSGINTDKMKLLAYVICGTFAALSGMVMLSRLGTGQANAGSGYELNAIAAAAIGGVSLAGGKGTVVGTMIGAFVITALKIGLIIIGMDSFWQYIATGIVILVAVSFEFIQTQIISAREKRKLKVKTVE